MANPPRLAVAVGTNAFPVSAAPVGARGYRTVSTLPARLAVTCLIYTASTKITVVWTRSSSTVTSGPAFMTGAFATCNITYAITTAIKRTHN